MIDSSTGALESIVPVNSGRPANPGKCGIVRYEQMNEATRSHPPHATEQYFAKVIKVRKKDSAVGTDLWRRPRILCRDLLNYKWALGPELCEVRRKN